MNKHKLKKVRRQRRDALILYPHHRKPYRIHHVATLIIALAVVCGSLFELGLVVGHNQRAPVPVPLAAKPATGSVTVVRSAYGYSFTADSASFTVNAVEGDASGATKPVTPDQLRANRPLVSATVQVKPGALSGRLAATQFSVRFKPDPATLTTAEKQPTNAGLTPSKVAAALFPVSPGSEVDVRMLSSAADTLHNQPVQKTVYEFTAKHGGGKSYAIQWAGVSKGRAFAVELDGLVGSSTVPGPFATVLDSLNISADQAVLGASTEAATLFTSTASADTKLDSKYLSDALSPAVVQIFHTVCGTLTIDNRLIGDSSCVSFSGSGFLATASGYIATNGHVVVYTAKDELADLLTSDDTVLHAYLQGEGLSDAQIAAVKADPAALAAQIAKVYDLPDRELHFSNEGELTLVALGTDQPDIKKLAGITNSTQLTSFRHDTTTIKQANIIGYNYAAKDGFTAIADPKAGFSSSDVALLKVDVQNAPTIPVETGQVVQNESIVVMGFPGDANNPLTDNQQTNVTVTDGVVSSIRAAAGGKGLLYQSDADASHGNSGGPAVDDQGRAIGLMTYRYADANSGDAPESYIRNIADFTALAEADNVTIDSRSVTQQDWERGLALYSKRHYSAALKDFNKVQSAYPAHRLVGSYIQSSQAAIAAGQDVTDLPVGLLVAVLLVAAGTAVATTVLIVRHHALHRVYQASVPDADNPQPVYLAKPSVPPTGPPKPQDGPDA